MAKFDIGGFLRDCYLHAEPSIDLRNVPDGEQINATDHKLKLSVYNDLLKKWGVTDYNGNAINDRVMYGVSWYCMNKGPTWVDDLPKAA